MVVKALGQVASELLWLPCPDWCTTEGRSPSIL